MARLSIRHILTAFAAILSSISAAPLAAAEMVREAASENGSREILVMLRIAPPHYRLGSGYGGSYGDAMASAARARTARQIAKRNGLTIVDGWPMPLIGVDCYVMQLPQGADLDEVIARVSREKSVAWSQPMQSYLIGTESRAGTKGDPLLPVQPTTSQWRLPELQRIAIGRGVRVAVIDSQIDVSHPDLTGQFVAIENFVRSPAAGSERHGTAVAGIIAAKSGNGVGIAGVAPGARLMALRACWEVRSGAKGSPTLCNSLSIARALQFAIENGADIVNLSLSGPRDRLLATLVNLALERNVTVIAAFDPDRPQGGFPAVLGGVMAVIDDASGRIPAGVYGAPGRGVPTTQPGGGWDLVNGTSYAVAQVSGLVALVGERGNRKARMELVRAPGGTIRACATVLGTAPQCDCECDLSVNTLTIDPS